MSKIPSVKKIIIVEDEQDILEIIEYNLKREGFEVLGKKNGEDGLALIIDKQPNLVLLDLMLPGIDGFEVCRRLRLNDKTKHIPVIMLTAKDEESDIVTGLSIGADDYITKPFSPRELVARVKAVLRREGVVKTENSNKICINDIDLVIDPDKHLVLFNKKKIEFTITEYKLLYFLAKNQGRVFTRDQLLENTVGQNTFVVDRNIDVYIQSIRKKLGKSRDIIETIRGVGYRFKDVVE